ncbi:PLAC8 family protein [Phytophthora cinnamomi]|uniref:PLAC8 family protein n=1 Tax=Phytophthora cinnamomi TaxID=4785 RepID=UPI00355A770F|nr:PLAC8 family protein [Phytophthora cinnamomi]KAG6622703.1 PLAC8 family protein [Phytophthora cinnamomi]
MSETPVTTATPAKPVEVPYSGQPDASAAQPAKSAETKDLESEGGLTRGQWEVGFWDCFTTLMPNCFMVTFCSCISIAQIASRLGVATYSQALAVCLAVIVAEFALSGFASAFNPASYFMETSSYGIMLGYLTTDSGSFGVFLYRIVTIFLHLVLIVFVMHLRTKTRERFQIPGTPQHDFAAACCCSCCALAQMATHIKSYKPGSCEFGPVADTLPAYSA